MVRWGLVAGSSLALTALLLLRKNSRQSGSNGKDQAEAASDEETMETVETHGTNAGDDGNDAGNGTDGTDGTGSSETEDPEEKRLLPLPVVEMVLIAVLVMLLVRGGALLGHTSEEQVKSGILPAEQVVWNFQKFLRCILVVLCFTSSYLQKHKLFDRANGNWPNMVFSRLSQELWLLPSNESDGVKQRRRLTLLLVALGRACLGTVRSFIKFRSHIDEKEQNICSGPFISWIIFLLDVTANCGFLLGFSAGRHYFAALRRGYVDVEADVSGSPAPESGPVQRPRGRRWPNRRGAVSYRPKTTVSRHFVKENKWIIPFLHVMLDVLCWSYCSLQPWNVVCFPTGRREFLEIAMMRSTSFECDPTSNPGHQISQDGV